MGKIYQKRDLRLVLFGPSGAGKTYLKNYLTKEKKYNEIKSYTTRPRRNKDESEYYFISHGSFLLHRNSLTNVNFYNGNYYGIAIEDFINQDKASILISDISNLDKLRNLAHDFNKNLIIAYCSPPSQKSIILRRHKERGTEDRYLISLKEVEDLSSSNFKADYIISNINEADAMDRRIRK